MDDRTIVDPNLPPMGVGEATRVMTVPGAAVAPAPAGVGYGEMTQQSLAQTCPVCSTPNPPTERYCQDCGLLFGSNTGDASLPDAGSMPRLSGEGGQELVLNPGPNAVGRERGDVVISHPTISRRHAVITVEGTTVTVEDLGSTNGTFVNGQPVRPGERIPAQHGTAIKFGSNAFTLNLPGNPAVAPAPVATPAPAAAPAAPVAAERGAAVAHLVLADGTEFPLYAGVNSLGRRSGNDVILADPFASGKHAEITCNEDGSAQLVDTGSTNGTFIAGERLAAHTPISLFDGMSVSFGKTPLTYRAAQTGDWGAPVETTRMLDADQLPDATIIGGGETGNSWDSPAGEVAEEGSRPPTA